MESNFSEEWNNITMHEHFFVLEKLKHYRDLHSSFSHPEFNTKTLESLCEVFNVNSDRMRSKAPNFD